MAKYQMARKRSIAELLTAYMACGHTLSQYG